MELRVLKYFLAAARENSITKAAAFLHVTQPTLSRQLQDLEEELGQKLMIRNNHTFALTPEGRLLRKRAEEILEIVQKTEEEFSAIGETIEGDVRIGCGESEAFRSCIRIIHEIQSEYPNIRFHLYSGNADDVIDRLDKGMIDFGVLIHPANTSKYNSLRFPQKDLWGLLMRKDHPLATKKEITPKDLLDIPLICSRIDVQHRTVKNAYVSWFGPYFDKLNIVATYNLIFNAKLMVEEGIGSVLGLDKLVHQGEDSNLCFRPLSPRLESELDLVWGKYQVFAPAASLFLRRLSEAWERS